MLIRNYIDQKAKEIEEFNNAKVINKTDLLPYVDFDVETAKDYAMKVNHHLEFIEMSVKTGEGIGKWYDWLRKNK